MNFKPDLPPRADDNTIKKSIEKIDDFEKNEKISELFDSYKDGVEKEESWKYWSSLSYDDQKFFFDNLNNTEIQKLFENFSDIKKIRVISFAMRHLQNTPSQAIEIIKGNETIEGFLKKFFEENKKHPKTTYDMNLLAVAAYRKYGENPNIEDEKLEYVDQDYWLRADRFNKAKKLLVSGYEESEINNIEKDFGDSSKGFSETFDLACQIDSMQVNDTRLSTKKMWGEEFEKLSDEKKSELLGRALATSHSALIFGEVWNSAFTPERVKRDNKHIHSSGFHNVAHSMIYGTYQSNSVYESEKKSFDREMNNTIERGGNLEEYPFQKIIIAILEKSEEIKNKDEKLVNLITEFWNKNRNPIFGAYIAEALSKIDPNKGASNLMKLIEEEKGEKNHLSSILYRIEFGQIGISEDGVKYLERMYDLGEYNNPSFYVERLTPRGEVGIFNEEKELVKYFELGDITTKEKNIKAEVLDFIYETLFYPKKDETEKEKTERLQYLNEFKNKYYKLANDEIFSETNTRLNNLTFKEQGSFLQYVSSSDDKNALYNFLRKYRENGIRTFISVQQGGKEMGDKILILGEKLPEDTAKIVFAKYGEIVDMVNSIEETIKKEYKLPPSPEMIDKLKETLLISGKNLLTSQGDKVLQGEFSEELLLKSLENTKTDIILFKNIFKIARENNPEMSFEDFYEIEPEKICDTSLISNEDISEIQKIITENYTTDKKLGEYAFDSFKKAIKENNNLSEVNFLKRNKKIIALDRLDIKEDGSAYFGSFNVDPKYCSSKIGDAFFQATILPQMKKGIVEADCPILQPISAYYIESGFVGNKINIVGETPLMSIVSNPNQSFESKKISKEEIIKLSNNKDSNIKVFSAKSQKELPLLNENEGKALTRYFFDKNSNLWYVAFE